MISNTPIDAPIPWSKRKQDEDDLARSYENAMVPLLKRVAPELNYREHGRKNDNHDIIVIRDGIHVGRIEVEVGTHQIDWKGHIPSERWWTRGLSIPMRKLRKLGSNWDLYIKINLYGDSFFSVTPRYIDEYGTIDRRVQNVVDTDNDFVSIRHKDITTCGGCVVDNFDLLKQQIYDIFGRSGNGKT